MIIDNGVACHDIHFIGEKVYLAQSRHSSQPFIASGTGSNLLRACIAQRKVGGSYIPMVWGLQPEISIGLYLLLRAENTIGAPGGLIRLCACRFRICRDNWTQLRWMLVLERLSDPRYRQRRKGDSSDVQSVSATIYGDLFLPHKFLIASRRFPHCIRPLSQDMTGY